jgi:phosphatidylglycerophosphatase A
MENTLHPKTPQTLSKANPAFWLSTWFGVGLLPVAPGTCGSLAALPFAWLLAYMSNPTVLVVISLIIFFMGWWSSHLYASITGRKDPKEVVIDEVAGQILALSFVPQTWVSYLLCFCIFRLLDIQKPWPISWADKQLGGGLGIMLDDIFAAIMTAAIMIALYMLGTYFQINILMDAPAVYALPA